MQGMDCKDSSEKYPIYAPNTRVCCVHFDGGKTVKILIPFLQDLCGLSLNKKKKRLSHVSQAARFFYEVDMDVDENISRKAGRL